MYEASRKDGWWKKVWLSITHVRFWWMFSRAFIFRNHLFLCLCLPGRCREVFSLQQFWMCRWGKTSSVGNFSSFPAAQLWLPWVCWELGPNTKARVKSRATEEQHIKSTPSHACTPHRPVPQTQAASSDRTGVLVTIIPHLCSLAMIDRNSGDERNPLPCACPEHWLSRWQRK